LWWLAGLSVLVLLLYRDTAVAMVGIWERSDTFAHAFLVPPIVAWLVWRKRAMLATFTPSPQPWVLLPLAGVMLLWLMADLVAVNAATQFALVAMLVLLVPAVLGFRIAWQLTFPLAFSFFCVPIGEFMLPQLMNWTADFTVWALQVSGIPVFREGNQFVIPSGNWSVVEACSGVRYLIASFMVGTLFAYLNFRSWQRRLAFCLVSIAVPVLANWVRAYLIVMIGHLSGNTLAVGVDHLVYGWLFFGLVILLMFFIGARWAQAEVPAPLPPPANSSRGQVAASPWLVGIGIAVLVLLPQVAGRASDAAGHSSQVLLQLPDALAHGWQGSDAALTSWKPQYRNPSAESLRTYRLGDQRVGLYVGYYRQQDYERKLVSSSNALVHTSDDAWVQLGQGVHVAAVASKLVTVRTATLRGSLGPGQGREQRLVVWQTYWVGGKLTSSDIEAKLLTAWNKVIGRGDDSAVVMVFTASDTADAGHALLQDFLSANLDVIESQLQLVRDGR
jgi:exosortase A